MASPYDPTSRVAVPKKQSAPFKFLVPLIYAPALPLIRIALRKNPVVRDRLFTAVLAGAFVHGFYLVYPFNSCICFYHFSFHIESELFNLVNSLFQCFSVCLLLFCICCFLEFTFLSHNSCGVLQHFTLDDHLCSLKQYAYC